MYCGVGAEIAAQLAEKAMMSLQAPVLRVTGYDTFIPYFQNEKYGRHLAKVYAQKEKYGAKNMVNVKSSKLP